MGQKGMDIFLLRMFGGGLGGRGYMGWTEEWDGDGDKNGGGWG